MGAFRCFNPLRIYNRNGELIEVPCGHCDACNNRKSERLRTMCDLEALNHRFCYFVTLTYAPAFIPLLYPHKDEFRGIYSFINVTDRLQSYYPGCVAVHSIKELPEFNFSLYFDKFNLPAEFRGLVPYLAPIDVQLFMKRLRKQLTKYSNEKIRYIAIGEYGPKHFRPHYHLLLWFDDEKIQKNIRKSVCSSWKYGRVDCQKSKTKSSSYVTKYVNSNSVLSRLHSFKAFHPFARHSVRLGEQLYAHEVEKVYEIEPKQLIDRSFIRDGRVKQCTPLLSFEDAYFPRCYKFNSFDSFQRELCYCIYNRASRDFKISNVSELSKVIYSYLYNRCFRDELSYLSCFSDAPKTIQLFCDFIGVDHFTDNTILSILYCSKKFLSLKEKYNVTTHHLLSCIDDYWSAKDYGALTNQLSSQIDFIDKYGVDMRYNFLWWYTNFRLITKQSVMNYDDNAEYLEYRKRHFLPVTHKDEMLVASMKPEYPQCVKDYIRSLGFSEEFFNEFFFNLSDNPAYVEFVKLQKKIARDAIKHKRLNDANKIFIY